MSSQQSVEPSPPKSRASSKRRPLHERTDSEVNESVRLAATRGEGTRDGGLESNKSLSSLSPFPNSESQILRPRADGLLRNAGPSFPHRSDSDLSSPIDSQANVAPTWSSLSTNYILTSHDRSANNDYPTSTLLVTPDKSLNEPELATPASTIRIVTADSSNPALPSSSSSVDTRDTGNATISGSRINTSLDPGNSAARTLSRRQRAGSALVRGPSTPTPSYRNLRYNLWNAYSTKSDQAARLTPSSARSANSSGTQVHRRQDAGNEQPDGSYLHFAAQRPRRSFSDPEAVTSSSPIIHTYASSSGPSPNTALSARETPEGWSSSGKYGSLALSRVPTGGFPALKRYLEAAEASSRSPSLHSEQSPVSEATLDWTPGGPSLRDNTLRLASLISSTTSQPQGTTAPSSIRVVSADPSNLFDEAENSLLTDVTFQSSIRLVPREHDAAYRGGRLSALSRNSDIQSSVRLVTPELSGDTEASILTTRSQMSIRLVEGEPEPLELQDASRQRETHRTSASDSTSSTVYREGGNMETGSPVWVSYSSPVQLPHIEHANANREIDREGSNSISSPDLDRSNPSASGSELSTRYASHDVTFSCDNSQAAKGPYRRRSVRQTSPFFHGTSGRAIPAYASVENWTREARPENRLRGWQESQTPMSDYSQRTADSSPPASMISFTSSRSALDQMEETSSIFQDHQGSSELLRFPATSSSINNSPGSVYMPRSRPFGRTSGIQHIRTQTLGSTRGSFGRNVDGNGLKSPRRSSSPVFPSNYPMPSTPQDRPPRPSNPTPGVTPGATPARNRSHWQSQLPAVPDMDADSEPASISYPSVVHRPSHYQLPGRVGHRDFSPHLWHGASQAINRRSLFRPPSVDEVQVRFMAGSKTRRDIQIACVALGFLVPVLWIAASFLPLPRKGNTAELSERARRWKGKGKIDDPEKLDSGDHGGFDGFTADEVAGYESARWWRGLNRCLSVLGVCLITVLIAIGVVTGRGGIQV